MTTTPTPVQALADEARAAAKELDYFASFTMTPRTDMQRAAARAVSALRALAAASATPVPAPAGAAALLADECKRLAKQMMRDSWATGDDSAWRPAYEQLCASLSQFTALAAPQPQPQAAAGLTEAEREADAFLVEVRAELIRARAKFPGDRIMTIALAEEFGELCKAVLDEPSANVRKEAVQTAVMACRVAVDGDGSVDAWRRERGLDPLTAAAVAAQPAAPDARAHPRSRRPSLRMGARAPPLHSNAPRRGHVADEGRPLALDSRPWQRPM